MLITSSRTVSDLECPSSRSVNRRTIKRGAKMSRFIKALLICGLVFAALGWLSYNNPSQSAPINPAELAKSKSEDYVGSDACKDCHEDQFKNFSHTSHAQLTKLASWKEKVTGCESCHGPGKAHIEEGDPKKIISFKNKSSKETSETCLGLSLRQRGTQQLPPRRALAQRHRLY